LTSQWVFGCFPEILLHNKYRPFLFQATAPFIATEDTTCKAVFTFQEVFAAKSRDWRYSWEIAGYSGEHHNKLLCIGDHQ